MIYLSSTIYTQWYKVYQDPKGIHSLGQSKHFDSINPKNAVTNGTADDYYKSKIRSLNEEIIALNKKNKTLNDELAMV